MNYRKLTAGLLSLPMLLCSVPAIPASAEEVLHYTDIEMAGSYDYINHGDHIEITGCTGAQLYFPSEIDGLPVTALAEGGYNEDKFRIPAGLNQDQTYVVSIPEGITTIPDGWFVDSSRLTTIILPESLTSIGDGVFAGCDGLCDVFFKGDSAAWDEIVIGGNNEALENACIHTEFNQSSGKEPVFVDGEDNWSFTNGDLTEYLLSNETIAKYLADCHPDSIPWFSTRADNWTGDDEYRGACAGFALSSYLASIGVLDPSDIYPGAETLHDIPFTEEGISAVVWYFLQTVYIDAMQWQMNTEWDESYVGSEAFFTALEQGTPMYIGYAVSLGMHAVLAYGVEYGEWQWGENTYTGRLLIYDNNFTGFDDEACIYFTDSLHTAYIPYWDSSANVADVFCNPDYVIYGIGNRETYETTYALGDVNLDAAVDASDAAEILIAAAAAGSGASSGLNNGQKSAADADSDKAYNATDAALILEYAAYAGSGGVLSFEAYLAL